MGSPLMDLRAFRARRLRNQLGVNVLVPVLPLHGPRQRPDANPGEGFMSIDLIDSVHGFAQAAWDVRSAIRWIRHHDASARVGVYGLSLGGYTAALTASLEDDLACVIAGIPATDLVDLYRRHSPVAVRRRARECGALGSEATAVHRVVSPLVLQPKPPRDRRYLFAGRGDRMSTAAQATRLWEHWGRPRMAWYPGGHVGFFWAGDVSRFVEDALAESGLVERGRTPASLATAAPAVTPHN
jgi:dienelactone hydrolase